MSSPGQQYCVVDEASLTNTHWNRHSNWELTDNLSPNWQITEVTLRQATHGPWRKIIMWRRYTCTRFEHHLADLLFLIRSCISVSLFKNGLDKQSTCYFDRITQSDGRCAQIPLDHKADRCESVAIAESEILTLITALTWFQLPWKNVTLNPQSQLPWIPWSMNLNKLCTRMNRRNWL